MPDEVINVTSEEPIVRLQPGDPAPPFALPNADGTVVTLEQYRGRWFLLYIYPKAARPGCTAQACAFRDNLRALNRVGYDVTGLSPDPLPELRAFRDSERLGYPLLSDPQHRVITAYGAYGPKTVQRPPHGWRHSLNLSHRRSRHGGGRSLRGHPRRARHRPSPGL